MDRASREAPANSCSQKLFPSGFVALAFQVHWNPIAVGSEAGSDLGAKDPGSGSFSVGTIYTGSGRLIRFFTVVQVLRATDGGGSFRDLQLWPNPSHLHGPLEPYWESGKSKGNVGPSL